jgi:hypothetical protein
MRAISRRPRPPRVRSWRRLDGMQRAPQRSQAGLVLSAAIIILAGFGIALVAMLIDKYRWPKASMLGVVGVAVLLVAVIRAVSTRKPRAGR